MGEETPKGGSKVQCVQRKRRWNLESCKISLCRSKAESKTKPPLQGHEDRIPSLPAPVIAGVSWSPKGKGIVPVLPSGELQASAQTLLENTPRKVEFVFCEAF